MRVSMGFKEGFSTHYQEKQLGILIFCKLQSSAFVYIYIYVCVCVCGIQGRVFEPLSRKKQLGIVIFCKLQSNAFVRLQTLLLSALEYVYFQNNPSVGYQNEMCGGPSWLSGQCSELISLGPRFDPAHYGCMYLSSYFMLNPPNHDAVYLRGIIIMD